MSYNPRIEELERKVGEGSTGGSVPVPTAEDVGKIPVVNADGEYELADVPTGLPSYTSADIGKVLTVMEDGSSATAAWENGGGGVSAVTLSNAFKSELSSKLTASAMSAISGSASVYVNSDTISNATADDIAAIKSVGTDAVNNGGLYSINYENIVYVLSGYNAGGSPATYGFSVDLGMYEVYGHVLRPTVKIFTDDTDVLVSYIIEYQY